MALAAADAARHATAMGLRLLLAAACKASPRRSGWRSGWWCALKEKTARRWWLAAWEGRRSVAIAVLLLPLAVVSVSAAPGEGISRVV